VDAATELLIRAALVELMRGRTTFVIAHRLSTVRAADLILVLQHGRLVDSGTHEELLDSSEVYRQIHASQLAEPQEALELRAGLFDAGGLDKELVS
jgi:ABC-type multidrug transport system fused ATPase/permease subunit